MATTGVGQLTDEVVRSLQQLRWRATNAHRLMAEIQASSFQPVEGWDPGGAVRVKLESDNLPEVIQVANDWQHRLAPRDFGPAVVKAYQAAANTRMQAWASVLEQSDWRIHAEQARSDAPQPATPEARASERDLRHVAPRPLGEVAEDMISAFDNIAGIGVELANPVQGKGKSSTRSVTITVTKNALVSCEVSPQWPSRRHPATVAQALNEALANARADLVRATAAAEAGGRRSQLDSLFGEALAILSDPQRFAD
ncbi:hypothetical protein AB0C51_13140 [Streptomyces pathocidini]|uniref:hypothetical protein n=1 Tax=Streptomyces pathocidini TaxID=1650571 RepID=UPI0033E78905